MNPWWSVALTAVGVTGLYFTLRKKWWGQAIALSGQLLWLAYAVHTRQWGFLGSVLAYGPLNLYGILTWRKDTMTPVPSPIVRVTRYDVTCLPPDDPNVDLFTLNVEWRGGQTWAVTRNGYCYDADGDREWETLPSGRTPEWLARFRHTQEEAIAIAEQLAPTLRVNGHSVADALQQADHG